MVVSLIAGTTVKVVELILETTAYGRSPEELHFQHLHLSLGQIHSALAYYWDHAAELDRDIERRMEKVKSKVRCQSISPQREAQGQRTNLMPVAHYMDVHVRHGERY
jgi:uncharacterized protein (DUF433 family)